MGLQNQLYDLSTDSIPLLLIALLVNSVTYLRSILLTFFKSNDSFEIRDDDATVRSGGSSCLVEQLGLNRVLSYRFVDDRTGSDCVVCLNGLREGEIVRKLDCRHVFHKECLDGWLRHLNFNCPLCRSSFMLEQRRVDLHRRRVGGDLVSWFSPW